MNELISVVIVNWNGKKWLKDCLESIKAQTYENVEVIFVDNASHDGSIEYAKKIYPNLKIIENKVNRGFAGGNNDAMGQVIGKYVLLLNSDTVCPRDYLEKFVKGFREHPNAGCIQSKIVLMDSRDKLDVAGIFWTDTTFLYYFGFEKRQDDEKYNKEFPVFSCKGASMMIRKDVIDKIGLFDDDFWNYYEETDFCHRVWLAGFECWYYPEAMIFHAVGGTSIRLNDSILQFHNFKNKLLSFLKNFEIKSLITVLPVYFFFNIGISFIWLFQGRMGHFTAIYKAIWWNVLNIRATFFKRSNIQKLRKKTDEEFMKKAKFNPRFSYYFYLFSNLRNYED